MMTNSNEMQRTLQSRCIYIFDASDLGAERELTPTIQNGAN